MPESARLILVELADTPLLASFACLCFVPFCDLLIDDTTRRHDCFFVSLHLQLLSRILAGQGRKQRLPLIIDGSLTLGA